MEDEPVHGKQSVPIEASHHADRIEDRRLQNFGLSIVALNLELKPGTTGQLHFRAKPKKLWRLHILYTPKIDSIPGAQLDKDAIFLVASLRLQTRGQ